LKTAFSDRESEPAGVLLRALVVGLLGGSAGLVLRFAATEGPRLVWPGSDLVQGVAHASPAARALVPAVGGLLAGLVLALGSRWAGGARGWDILEAVVLRNGVLPLRSALVRAASSLVTQASAGAVGREGPIVLVAAATASGVGGRLGIPTRERRVLVACGIAAGLACAYNTPLGAALFAMEIILGSVSLEAFAPLAVSSSTATLLTWTAFGRDPIFHVPAATLSSAWEIVLYALLGVLGGVVAALFLFALRACAALYARSGLPRPVAMATAGLALGLVTLRYPEIVGNGREAIAALFARPWGWSIEHVVALLALRLVVTPLAVGSGTVGGVFTPTLFLGAMTGHAFGASVRAFAPGLGADPAAFALAGMGALLAGTTHAPLTAVVMVFEMTLDYGIVVPLLLGSAVASLVATRLSASSVYTEALRRQAGEGDVHGALDVLRVADLVRPDQVTVAPDLSLPRLLDAFVASRRNHLYVVDGSGRFLGAVNLHDVNDALRAGEQGPLAARDVARKRFEVTVPEEGLPRVLDRFAAQECERLPVLADLESRRLVGTISKRDILSVYSLELLQRSAGRRPSRPIEPPIETLVDEVWLPAGLEGRTFAESRFRDTHALALLLVRRGAAGLLIPDAELRFAAGDRLVVFGPRDRIAALRGPHS
jgi:CIC family chloride channel protein